MRATLLKASFSGISTRSKLLHRVSSVRIVVTFRMITTFTLAAGVLAVAAIVITVMTRLLVNRVHAVGDRPMRDLGPDSRQWLGGHRTESP